MKYIELSVNLLVLIESLQNYLFKNKIIFLLSKLKKIFDIYLKQKYKKYIELNVNLLVFKKNRESSKKSSIFI